MIVELMDDPTRGNAPDLCWGYKLFHPYHDINFSCVFISKYCLCHCGILIFLSWSDTSKVDTNI